MPVGDIRGYFPIKDRNMNDNMPDPVPLATWGLVVGSIVAIVVLSVAFKGKINF